MNKDYFSKVRVLDGGMGQTLLEKGLKAKGSLWSATALIDEKYHQLIIDTHLDFIKSGADVIVTNNFSARRSRTISNNVEEHFEYANEKAGELALKAKKYGANYVAFGSFFKSSTKKTAFKANLGILRWAKKKINMPIIAIGGINSSNYKKILSNGADFIACSSYIWNNKRLDPVAAINKFKFKK